MKGSKSRSVILSESCTKS